MVAGSVAMQPLLEKWAAAFRAAHPSQPVVVQGGGSTAGVRAVQMGKAQCGALSRPLHPDETGVTAVPVALEALALVVNPKNPVDALTIAEAHALLVGGATSWKAVGGPDGAVDVVARGADARTLVDDVVTGQDPPPATAKVLDSAEQVRAAVAADASAIGYLPLPLVDRTVKAIKVAGVEASAQAAQKGSYPLARPFSLVVRGAPAGVTRDFVDFARSPAGQAIARGEGFLPVP